ncbi:unnamed protein product [Phytophthora fragariaefolia]|uniref:Unnamed protein product n=1 Tax=Phytophthora fragariaefolia TaxID=1490495 RepID=A0A9W6YDP6_9STRA|nr:unnamed protein product [Phytophthora fragariaefolia]
MNEDLVSSDGDTCISEVMREVHEEEDDDFAGNQDRSVPEVPRSYYDPLGHVDEEEYDEHEFAVARRGPSGFISIRIDLSSRKTAPQTEDESTNLRPYQAPGMDPTDASQVPGAEGYAEFEAMAEEKQYAEVPPPSAGANVGPTTPAPPAGPSPPVRPGSALAATSSEQGAYVPPPAVPLATDAAQMLASLVNMFSLQQQPIATSQQQMHAFMVQQARFQQAMYEMQARANRQKQKAIHVGHQHARDSEALVLPAELACGHELVRLVELPSHVEGHDRSCSTL